MKVKIKIALCALLLVAALASLAAVLGSIASMPVSAMADQYVVGELDGYVAVYRAGDDQTPMSVTELRVSTLPLADRMSLAAGIPLEDYGEVVRLLEDLGA